MDKEHEIIGKIMEEQAEFVEKELEKVKGYYISDGKEFSKLMLQDFPIRRPSQRQSAVAQVQFHQRQQALLLTKRLRYTARSVSFHYPPEKFARHQTQNENR